MKDKAIEQQNKDGDEAEYQRRAFLFDPHHGNADPDTPENRKRLRKAVASGQLPVASGQRPRP